MAKHRSHSNRLPRAIPRMRPESARVVRISLRRFAQRLRCRMRRIRRIAWLEYQMFDRALDAMYSQRLDAAIRGFQKVLAGIATICRPADSLGDAYLRAGKSGRCGSRVDRGAHAGSRICSRRAGSASIT